MDPLLLLTEWWWTVPAAAGAVAAGAFGLRRRSSIAGRRLEVDAAKQDLRIARQLIPQTQLAVKVARAELARVVAEKSARRATGDHVAGARRMLRDRQNEAKSAIADVKAKQARLSAARASVPSASDPTPLQRLQGQHDAVVARWMAYETDASLQIGYPAMTDVKQPATAAYLRAAGHATEMRRATTGVPSAASFSAYRDAVAELERAFEMAEHQARVQAGEVPASSAWQDAAQGMISRSTEAIDRAAEAAASAFAAWTERKRKDLS